MAKRMYTSVDGKARLVKKMYTGVNGIARKVKKAYVGVGGVARLFYKNGAELVYNGQCTNLTASIPASLSSTHNSNYVMFAGGYYSPTITTSAFHSNADAYDKNLTKIQAPNLSQPRRELGGASVNEYMLFGGGFGGTSSSGGSNLRTLDCYSPDLTRTTLANLANTVRGIGLSTPHYAVFSDSLFNEPLIDVITPNLTATTASRSVSLGNSGMATVGDYFLVAGGETSTSNVFTNICDVFNKNLVRSSGPTLRTSKERIVGISMPSYAVFCGGYYYAKGDSSPSKYPTDIDAYDNNLVRHALTDLPSKQPTTGASVTNGEDTALVVFTGREWMYYDTNLTLSNYSSLSSVTSSEHLLQTAEPIGNNILVAGSYSSSSSGTNNNVFRFTLT